MKTIRINAKEIQVLGNGEITYEEICGFAHPPHYTVTYYDKGKNSGGSLCKGKSIKVENGMSFDCVDTGNA
jgi:hypothetical protein